MSGQILPEIETIGPPVWSGDVPGRNEQIFAPRPDRRSTGVMSVEIERATLPCGVCGAGVTELRRGRCWGCYMRWAESRPVGRGAACTVCGEKRRAQLKLVELKGRSLPFCHGCAAQVMRLPEVPVTVEELRQALRRDRRDDDRRAGSKVDQRIFPARATGGRAARPDARRLRRHRPAHQARRREPGRRHHRARRRRSGRGRSDPGPRPNPAGAASAAAGDSLSESGSSIFHSLPSRTRVERMAIAGRRVDLDLGAVALAMHGAHAGRLPRGRRPAHGEEVLGLGDEAAALVRLDESKASMRARVSGPRRWYTEARSPLRAAAMKR